MARPFRLSRRAVLRGAGTLIALPLLEAMVPSVARAQSLSPRRFVSWFFPNGYYRAQGGSTRDDWRPTGVGSGTAWSLSPILAPLEPFKSQLQVLTGVSNPAAKQTDVVDQHLQGTGSFLSCVGVSGATQSSGVTVDQVAAATLGQRTRFGSLVLGWDAGRGGSSFSTTISWADARTPIAKQTRPDQVFERLFAVADAKLSATELAKRRHYRKSILDSARGGAERLQSRLGAADRRKLDEYFTALRELEQRVSTAASTPAPTCAPGAKPVPSADTQARVRQMLDVLVLAFQCDLTRVATFMFDTAGSDIPYPFLSVGGAPILDGHHTLSHHQNRAVNLDRLRVILTWHVEQLAYFLGRLSAVSDAQGPLLDSAAVFFSSELGDGNLHEQDYLPVVVAGRAGGALGGDRHLVYEPGQALKSNLFLTLLGAVGVPTSTFGKDGTQPLQGLGA